MAEALAAYEQLAAAVLPQEIRDFVAGGSGTEATLRLNRTALDKATLTPRVLAGIAEPDTSGTPSHSRPRWWRRILSTWRQRRTRWSGGFFVVVTVPFAVDDVLLEKSAHEYGVLWTPMSHFYYGDAPIHALRLSCSAVTPDQIDAALNRLAALITDHLP